MFKGQPETGKQQPENIQQKRSGTAAVSYFLSKGEKTQREKPRNTLLIIEHKLMVTRGEGSVGMGETGDGD